VRKFHLHAEIMPRLHPLFQLALSQLTKEESQSLRLDQEANRMDAKPSQASTRFLIGTQFLSLNGTR
jgi:hypothetical protein